MIWWIAGILTIVLIGLITYRIVSYIKKNKEEKEYRNNLYLAVENLLDKKGFYRAKVCIIDNHLSVAVNKDNTRLLIVENFNPNLPNIYNFEEVPIRLIRSLTRSKSSIQLEYLKNGDIKTIIINDITKDVEKFIYNLYKTRCFIRLQERFYDVPFDCFEGSDFECSYFWAYSTKGNIFGYMNTNSEKEIGKIYLLKEIFTLDIKYNYFEAPIMGINQQLFSYSDSFFAEIFNSLLSAIKQKTIKVLDDAIYYDNYLNVVYLTNGINSIQSISLDKIKEVYYTQNKIYFSLKDDEDKVINFITNEETIKEFSEFVIGYNLRKIATNFDYKTDKLLNTTDNTKLIIDYSRLRIVYCANIDTLSKFSYINLSFDNIKEAKLIGKKLKPFLRIITKHNEAIDVTINKYEVAQYAHALIMKIVDERN